MLSEPEVVQLVVDGLRWVAFGLGSCVAASMVAALVVHALQPGRVLRAMAGAGVLLPVSVASPSGPAEPVAVMRRLDTAPSASAPPAPSPEPVPAAAVREWTVRPGDHFWRIAEDVLTTALHRAPADHETDPYWQRLVDANRDRLVDRANPDLLFPGQVLVLPAA